MKSPEDNDYYKDVDKFIDNDPAVPPIMNKFMAGGVSIAEYAERLEEAYKDYITRANSSRESIHATADEKHLKSA